jgi:hypothetical protein
MISFMISDEPGEGTSRVHLAALPCVRARGQEEPREPSGIPMHRLRVRLQLRRERGKNIAAGHAVNAP